MSKKFYWLKLKEDFFSNKEIKKLRSIAGGDTYTIIYLKMQLLSLKNEGKLLYDCLEDTFAEEIALEINESVENVKITLMFLQKHKLIEEVNNYEYSLPQAQMAIGKESDVTQRVRLHRERIKLLQCNEKALHCNANVTKRNTDIDIDIDIKKEKEKVKKEKIDFSQFHFLENEEFKKTFDDFLEMRKKNRKSATDRAQELILKKLHQEQLYTAIEMLEQSITNSWTDVYELKTKTGENYANKQVNKFKAGSIQQAEEYIRQSNAEIISRLAKQNTINGFDNS